MEPAQEPEQEQELPALVSQQPRQPSAQGAQGVLAWLKRAVNRVMGRLCVLLSRVLPQPPEEERENRPGVQFGVKCGLQWLAFALLCWDSKGKKEKHAQASVNGICVGKLESFVNDVFTLFAC